MDTISERVPIYQPDCPAQTVIDLLADKWALFILAALRHNGRPARFNELRRMLGGVTQKMLTQTLRALERDGLVQRDYYPTVPPRVEYSLTELGLGAGQLTDAIGEWSQANVRRIQAARERYDASARAEVVPVGVVRA